MPDDALKVPVKAAAPSSAGGDVHAGELNGDSEMSEIAADDAIVGSLIGTGDAESVGRAGESASATVPSAEEGLNLWDPEEGREATAPRDVTSMQVPHHCDCRYHGVVGVYRGHFPVFRRCSFVGFHTQASIIS